MVYIRIPYVFRVHTTRVCIQLFCCHDPTTTKGKESKINKYWLKIKPIHNHLHTATCIPDGSSRIELSFHLVQPADWAIVSDIPESVVLYYITHAKGCAGSTLIKGFTVWKKKKIQTNAKHVRSSRLQDAQPKHFLTLIFGLIVVAGFIRNAFTVCIFPHTRMISTVTGSCVTTVNHVLDREIDRWPCCFPLDVDTI